MASRKTTVPSKKAVKKQATKKTSRTTTAVKAAGKRVKAAAKRVVAKKKAAVKGLVGKGRKTSSGQSGHVLGIGAPKVRKPVAGRKPKGLSVADARPRGATLRRSRTRF